jgi:hypothetical protein
VPDARRWAMPYADTHSWRKESQRVSLRLCGQRGHSYTAAAATARKIMMDERRRENK